MAVGTGRGLVGVMQLFGGLGLSAKPIDKDDSDSGIAIDGTEVIFEGKADTDVGVGIGTEPTDFISATVPNTDPGVGVDAQEDIQVTLSDNTESGTGTESESFSVTAPDSETGVGADTESITMNLSSTDSGKAVDTPKLDFDRALIIEVTSISTDITIEVDWS